MKSLLLVAALFVSAPDSDRWTGFLGEGQRNVAPETIPTEWSAESNVAWQADLNGYGQSSPVVWRDKVFVTCVDGANKETGIVTCLDLKNGEELWSHEFETTDGAESSIYVSRAAPTPVVDSQNLFAFFESGDLLCLSHDGELLWQRSLSTDYGKFENRFCLAASPIQDADSIYLLADHEGPSYLARINKSDGRTVWKADRTSRVSWTSPIWMMVDGKPAIVVSSQGSIDGYDPDDGQQLWSYDEVFGNSVATPAVAGSDTFIVGASPGPRATPEQSDQAGRSNLAMKIVNKDGKLVPEVLWLAERATCSFGSPMVHDGYAYWINDKGILSCFDVQTGEEKYKERVSDSCWATPVGIGDRVYFFGKNGETTVLASGPEFRVISESRLWDAAPADPSEGGDHPGHAGRKQYGVAVVDGSLLVRTGDILFCLRKSD